MTSCWSTFSHRSLRIATTPRTVVFWGGKGMWRRSGVTNPKERRKIERIEKLKNAEWGCDDIQKPPVSQPRSSSLLELNRSLSLERDREISELSLFDDIDQSLVSDMPRQELREKERLRDLREVSDHVETQIRESIERGMAKQRKDSLSQRYTLHHVQTQPSRSFPSATQQPVRRFRSTTEQGEEVVRARTTLRRSVSLLKLTICPSTP